MSNNDTITDRKVFAAAAAAYCIANIGWWLQPLIINEAIERFSVGEVNGGIISSAEMIMVSISSLIFSCLFGKYTLRSIALLGFAVAFVGSVCSVVADTYFELLLSRSITGIGEGTLLATAVVSLATFVDPDRAYGHVNMISIIFGTAAGYSLPISKGLFGTDNVLFPTILASVTVLAMLAFLLPSTSQSDPKVQFTRPVHGLLSVKLISLASSMFLVTVTTAAMWSFFYFLGTRAGLNDHETHTAIAASAILSVCGAFLASTVGRKERRLMPLSAGIVVLTVAIVSMSLFHQALVFRIGAVLVVAGTFFVFSLFLGYAAEQDPSGRDAATIAGVFLFTGAVGPYLGGYLLENFSKTVMAILVLVTNSAAWLMLYSYSRREIPRKVT